MQDSLRMLHPRLVEALKKEGYRSLNPVQKKAIPFILQGYHVLLSAPTGSGKTEAAFFPILSMMLERDLVKRKGLIYFIYITPLRALNRDIYWRMVSLSQRLGFDIMIRHGDTPESLRRKMVREPPHILITTPETLQILLLGRKIRELLRGVLWVVIDEVHELIGDKRGVQLSIGLERLRSLTYRKKFQRIGLSATVSDLNIAREFLCPYQTVIPIQVGVERRISIEVVDPGDVETVPPSIYSEEHLTVEVARRIGKIKKYLDKYGSLLIFTNTRDTAEALGLRLALFYGDEVKVHHGSLSRDKRLEAEREFKNSRIRALVCTSSMELGIDIGHVDFVVQYMSPRQAVKLVQRIGRSGHHLTREAKGAVIAVDFDDILESLVLARRAMKGEIEELEYHWKPYDVLAHQIVGMVLERREVSFSEIYEKVLHSHAYGELTLGELRKVVEFLAQIGFLSVRGDHIRARRGSIQYYYENVSMIPDVSKYKVRDISAMKFIGELDEDFVSLRCEEGYRFILAGKVWSVVNIDEEKGIVNVTPAPSYLGALPAWEGELIPVTFKVAREVGSLRRRLKMVVEGKYSYGKILSEYPASKNLFESLLKFIKRVLEKGYPIPDDRTVVLEEGGRALIVHACLGTKINTALGLFLSYSLSRKLGARVTYTMDPYRVLLLSSVKLDSRHVTSLLLDTPLSDLENGLINAIKGSFMYRSRLIQVAKRFGVISKGKRVRVSPALLKAFEGTPVAEEALKEILVEKIDLRGFIEFAEKLRKKRLQLITVKADFEEGVHSPFSEPILKAGSRYDTTFDLTSSMHLKNIVKERLLNTSLTLVCMHCLATRTVKVKEVEERPRCIKCGSVLLAVVYPGDLEAKLKVLRKRKRGVRLKKEEKALLERVARTASLVASYGRRAVFVLAGRGIGPTTATRILSKAASEDELIKGVIKAEREYFRTRAFWD